MKVYDKNAVARHLFLSSKRIKQLTDKGILKEVVPGMYDMTEARRAYIEYLRDSGGTEESVDYATERAKLVRVKRENEELELQLKKGELHRSDDIEKILSAMLINFKSRLMAIPAEEAPKLAQMKDKTKIFKYLTEKIREALNELGDFQTVFEEEIKEDEEENS